MAERELNFFPTIPGAMTEENRSTTWLSLLHEIAADTYQFYFVFTNGEICHKILTSTSPCPPSSRGSRLFLFPVESKRSRNPSKATCKLSTILPDNMVFGNLLYHQLVGHRDFVQETEFSFFFSPLLHLEFQHEFFDLSKIPRHIIISRSVQSVCHKW